MSERAGTSATEATDVGSVFVSNYPPYAAWNPGAIGEAHRILGQPPAPDTPLGLYLHIPFCRIRCKFCYYKVYTDMDSAQIRSYLSGLSTEVEMLAAKPAVAGRPLKFVYFGGGTPSFISAKDLKALVARLTAAIPWTNAEEITFECEPGTLTKPKIEAIRGIGVTRLSLGVENFNDAILEENGRAHLTPEIYRVMPWIREAGFEQLNIDLIAGMVGETWETWRDTVKKTIEQDPDSVTIYQMELPYNTVYSNELRSGRLDVPVADWALKRAWHDYAINEMEAAGFEISTAYTMVKKGRGSRFIYRDAVWRGCDMLGTGVASFSHVHGVHFQNESEQGVYLARLAKGELPIARAYATTPRERLTRELILQFKEGVLDPASFQGKFGTSIETEFAAAFTDLRRQGLLVDDGRLLRLTREGLLKVDLLLSEFYAPEFRNTRYT